MGQRKVPRYFTVRQAYDWLSDAIDSFLQVQTNGTLQPIAKFIWDYLNPTRKRLEAQTLLEGNR